VSTSHIAPANTGKGRLEKLTQGGSGTGGDWIGPGDLDSHIGGKRHIGGEDCEPEITWKTPAGVDQLSKPRQIVPV